MKHIVVNRVLVIQFVTVLSLLALLFGASYSVWARHQWVENNLSSLEPRYARLQGLVDNRTQLRELSAKVEEALALQVYPSAMDVAKAGNETQQRIRSIFAESKLDIISIQVLPAKDEGPFGRISISLRVEGDLAGIQSALEKLDAVTPVVKLDSMSLQTIGPVRPASIPRLSGQFGFSVFRLRP